MFLIQLFFSGNTSIDGWNLAVVAFLRVPQALRTATPRNYVPICSPNNQLKKNYSLDHPGLQNGDDDGIALLSPKGDLVQFLSYSVRSPEKIGKS